MSDDLTSFNFDMSFIDFSWARASNSLESDCNTTGEDVFWMPSLY